MLKNILTSLALAAAFTVTNNAMAEDVETAHTTPIAPLASTAPALEMRLYTLDCGTVIVNNLNAFSTEDAYSNVSKTLASSCFLIKHADHWLLWDAGLPDALKGTVDTTTLPGFKLTVKRTLVEQLKDIGLTPADIDYVAVSHWHYDHIGKLPLLENATLIMHQADFETLSARKEPELKTAIAPFLDKENVQAVEGDYDIFKDGLLQMVALPGHTHGHMALKLELPKAGTIILSGDQYHFEENRTNRGVPDFNADAEQTLASHDRLENMLEIEDAKLIIQHEAKHLAKLPPLPGYLQ